MEALVLTASEIGYSIECDVLVVGINMSNGEYILFQQQIEKEEAMNSPPYFEYKDQLYGGYGLIKKCTLGE